MARRRFGYDFLLTKDRWPPYEPAKKAITDVETTAGRAPFSGGRAMRLQPSRFFQVPLTLFVVSVVVLIAALMRFGGGAGAPLPAWAQASSCGNAIVEPPEQCDPPGNVGQCPGSPGGSFLPCNLDCTCPPVSSCGNAMPDPGEDCDPPGSLTCPSGVTGGGNLACNRDCTCPPPCSPTP